MGSSPADFLLQVSHELRMPIYGVLGMTELALDEPLSATVRDYLSVVHDSATTLLARLDDILDYSSVESGRLPLELTTFDLSQLVRDVVASYGERADELELRLTSHIEADVPNVCVGEARCLWYVLRGMIGHAMQQVEPGELSLRVSVHERSPSAVVICFELTGKHSSLVQPRRPEANSAVTKLPLSSDLGMTIANRLSRLLRGKIESSDQEPADGLYRISFQYPAQEEAAKSGRPLTATRLAGPLSFDRPRYPTLHDHEGRSRSSKDPRRLPIRVLLAEDTVANQKIVKRILSKRGHQVEVARNGREVIEKLAAAPYDVVLMDLQMPTMDGLEATTVIRASEESLGRHVPIIALTAHVIPGDRERCLAVGMDAYLAKPVSTQDLIDAVESTSRSAAAYVEPATAGMPGTARTAPASARTAPISENAGDAQMPWHFKPEKVLRRLGDDQQLLMTLIDFFCEDYPGLLERIERGLEAEDVAEVALAAHSLKGLAANFDASLAMTAAASVETEANRRELAEARCEAVTLNREIRRLGESLTDYRHQG